MLQIQDLYKSYPDGWTLSGVSFDVREGEILCLLGPSGCGKTTLLRLIAGLEVPERGKIMVNGEDISQVPSHLRGFGLMFQEYSLFPHKDVFDNVAFGLRMAGWGREAIRQRVVEVLEVVRLAGFERRDVNQLSGGERQRVALARSLAPQPRLLMLDEPLGALDRALRERLLDELPAILKQVGVTSIAVTHDQEEAFAIADRVIVMRDGRVVQQGTPEHVYRQPVSPWTARFLGLTNHLSARVVSAGLVETVLGPIQVMDTGTREAGAEGTLLIRPEAARPGGEEVNRVSGVVSNRVFRGSFHRLELAFSGRAELSVDWSAAWQVPEVGEEVELSLDLDGLVLLFE